LRYITLSFPYSDPLGFGFDTSKSMTTSDDGIMSRQAADYEPSEPAAMVAKSSVDTFSTPGRYTYMIMQ
jgi:hypothetical protein